ncbi:PREDICTED: uncharacterized protein LOC108554785 [Eufriesea mexicana]|uniref:uncharacterized protein LOC108554785 n=1 Tax=Eufriesea mexicana TaxID=516756 RepID=UPI00083BE7EA|nr:PREDICTED: uncharacterized protein LOC108554785 [Eufriesea mexicana]
MKDLLVTVIILLTVAAARADFKSRYIDGVKDSIEPCAKENGLTGQSPEDIFDKDSSTGVDQPSCLRSCILKSNEHIKDSKLNVEVINKFVSHVFAGQPDVIKTQQENVAKCIEEVKNVQEECKMAYSFIQCMMDKF